MGEESIAHFIEAMGLIAQSDGTTRIAGQIFGYLLVEGKPRSLQQMAEALQISKASASTNARMLEARGVLRRVARMGSRLDEWEAVPEPETSLLDTLARKFRENADTMSRLSGHFPQERQDARRRVENFAGFYRDSADFMDEWMARLRMNAVGAAGQAGPEGN